MSETKVQSVELGGIRQAVNPFRVPPFSLSAARNVVSRNKGELTTRPGFIRHGPVLDAAINSMFAFPSNGVVGNRLIVHKGSSGAGALVYDSDGLGTAWTALSGIFDARGILNPSYLNANLYLNTSAGIYKMTSYSSAPTLAGPPKGLDGSAAVNAGGSMLANNMQVAYRIVWGTTDANSNKITGTPSQRIICSNTAGAARDVDLDFSIPDGVTTSHFYQVYRSGQAATTVEPDDELLLVVEKAPTSAQITAKAVTYTDSTPDSLRGATLYTSPSQEGILQANGRPPLSYCVCAYRDMMLYGHISYLQGMAINLISAGSPGVQVNDTITIAGLTYTAKNAETIASREFQLFTAGTPSENIANTAKSLVKVINRHTGNTTVYAYYTSGYSDVPGKMWIEYRTHPSTTFYATSSRGAAFSPELPAAGTTYASTADTYSNGVAVSKNGQPEAVPTLNRLNVGQKNLSHVMQILALRDSAIVLTATGAYRINGDSPANLTVSPLDLSVLFKSSNFDYPLYIFGCVANNAVYAWAVQGFVRISESDAAIISTELTTTPGTRPMGFDAQKEVWVAASGGVFWTFNYDTGAWTTGVFEGSDSLADDACAVADYSTVSTVFVGETGSTPYVRRLRITGDPSAERELAVTIVSSSGMTVTVNDTTGIAAGWTLAYLDGGVVPSTTQRSVVASVLNSTQLSVRDTISWTPGSAKAYEPITSTLTFHPQHHGSPSTPKLWKRIWLFLKSAAFAKVTVSLGTELTGALEGVDLVPNTALSWQALGTYIPITKNRGYLLQITISHSQAFTPLYLDGLGIDAELVSGNTR